MGLERYEILEPIGAGAAADVHRARDTLLGRMVALKFLRADRREASVHRERFLREARAAARLSHRHVVRIFEAGLEGEEPYLALELVDGGSLADRLPGLGRGDVLRIVEEAARAIDSAHAAGIVHRDLKPSNILLTAGGEARVADFGLAAWAEASTALTDPGAVLGTPHYMAPEQIEGPGGVGPWTDVYALGAVLYEALLGRRPHAGQSSAEILDRILHAAPARPRSVDPDLPRDLERIVLRAMARQPDLRYASAGALADDLARARAGQSVRARPAAGGRRLARRLAIGLGLFLVALAGIMIVGHRPDTGRDSTSIEPTPPTAPDAGEARRQAHARLATARPILESARDLTYDPDFEPSELHRRLEQARRLIDEAVALDAELALAHYHRGRILELEGDLDGAAEALVRAIELDDAFGPARYHLGRILLVRSYLLSISSRSFGRLRTLDDALQAAREASFQIERAMAQGSGLDDALAQMLASALLAHANTDRESLERIARAGLARFQGERGVEEFEWILGLIEPNDERIAACDRTLALRPGHAIAILCRGMARSQVGRLADALADYERAIDIQPRLLLARHNRATILHSLGRFEESIAAFTGILEIETGWALVWVGRAAVRRDAGYARASLSDADRAIEIEPGRPEGHNARALALADLGRPEEAMALLDEMVARHPDHAYTSSLRAYLHALSGRPENALLDLDRAVALDPRNALHHINRGLVRLELGDAGGARRDLDAAIEFEPSNARAHRLLGSLHQAEGRVDEALASFDRAIELDPAALVAHRGRLVILFGKRDRDGALAAIEAILRLAGDDPEVRFEAAPYLERLGRAAEAIAIYDAQIERDPDSADAHALRARAMAQLGRLADAWSDAETALRLDPDNPEALLQHAILHARAGRLQEALVEFDRLLSLVPGSFDGRAGRGRARLAAGDPAGGIADLEQAIERLPAEDPQRAYFQGLIDQARGD